MRSAGINRISLLRRSFRQMNRLVFGIPMIERIVGLALVVSVALASVVSTLQVMASSDQLRHDLNEQLDMVIYLPAVFGTEPSVESPAGVYDCLEYEFGLIWTSEVITLNTDGSSIYNYAPPYGAVVTGTWVYTPASQLVGFTNFRWLTATYTAPDRLWAERYLPEVDFEIALSCLRQVSTP